MQSKLLTWLTRPIIVLPKKPPAPSPAVILIWKIMVALVIMLVCWFVVWRGLLYREVNHRFAQIHAAGYPTSGAELNTWLPVIPDAENGALVLTQAFALLRTFPDERAKSITQNGLLARTNHWSPETLTLVENYLATNAPALARAREALRFARFRFPVDYNFVLPDMPHLGNLKTLARVAALQASLDAANGRGEAWPDQVEFQLQLAATLDCDPTLLPHLVRNAILRQAAQATERNLNFTNPSREACWSLRQAFIRAGSTNLLPFALATERAALIPAFRLSKEQMRSAGQNDPPGDQPAQRQRYSGKPAPLIWLTGFMERDLNFFLETMEKSIAVAALLPKENLALKNFYKEQVDNVARRRYYILSGLLLPSYSRLTVREVTAHTHIELVKTALAIECFRRDQGHLPGDLKELVPQYLQAVPTDPFDGALLRYRHQPKGYVVYSVGADGLDDGGREEPARKQNSDNSSYDLTFTVER